MRRHRPDPRILDPIHFVRPVLERGPVEGLEKGGGAREDKPDRRLDEPGVRLVPSGRARFRTSSEPAATQGFLCWCDDNRGQHLLAQLDKQSKTKSCCVLIR